MYALRLSLALIAVAVLLGTGVFAWSRLGRETRPALIQTTITNKPRIGGPFSLIDHAGRTVTEATYRGKALLVYFGYTYCPDICPTDLQNMAQVLDRLGPKADKVQALFVTVDPGRDTPEALAGHVSLFHPDIVGLTGTSEQIAAAAAAYQVFYAEVPPEAAGTTEYLMDHSVYTYLLAPDGEFVRMFGHDTPPEEIAEEIRAILN